MQHLYIQNCSERTIFCAPKVIQEVNFQKTSLGLVTDCQCTLSLLHLINNTIKDKLLIIHCNANDKLECLRRWCCCCCCYGCHCYSQARLGMVQRAGLELVSLSWTLFYRPRRYALKTNNYLFVLIGPSLVKEGISGTVPAILGLLPTWVIASAMSHLVEFSKNKYKRHKHRMVRRQHTPWQVTAARTTETSTRAAGDEGLSDAQSVWVLWSWAPARGGGAGWASAHPGKKSGWTWPPWKF